MRKLKLFLSMLMLIAFSVGNVWAAEELKATLDFTSQANWNIPTSGTNTAAASFTDGTYTIQLAATTNYKLNSGYLILGKSGSSLTLPAFEWTTTKILVTGTSGASTSVKQNIFVGSDAVSTETTGAQNVTNTYEIASASQAAGTIYILKITSAHNTQIAKIEIYGEGEGGGSTKTLESLVISGDPTKTSYYAGQDFDPAGLTVTGTYSDQSTATITSGIEWSYSPSQELALNQTSIGVTATVGNISSEEYNVDVTVTEAPAAVNYEKIIAEPADWSGEYLLVYEADATNARVWKGADQANNYAEATIANDVIAAPEGAAVLTIAKVAESDPVVYTIMVGDKYIGQTSDANGIKIQASAIDNSISYNGTEAAIDIVASSAHLRYNSASSSFFRYYKSATYSSQKKIQLYKKVEGAVKPAAGLEYAEADLKKLAKLGDAFTAPTLINPNSLSVTYASNNDNVVEVDANSGALTIKAAGVAVITASFAGNDNFKAGSASYTIGVTAHAGTEADPYDAADAKIAIDAKGTVENVYASGVVSNVVTSTLPAEGYITFYFSANGGTTSQQIEAFKCMSLNGEAFSAVTDVVTGATVVITGTLMKYNSTYEFEANCHLVSYTAPATQKTHIANDQAHPYTVAQAITFAADGVTYDLDDFVYVQGVVYDVKNFNNGAMNIFIKDANAENQFELYKCAGIYDGTSTAPTPFEALSDVQSTNIVIAYGQLTVYNNVYELKQGNYLVDFQAPVTAVEMDATAEVEVGSTVTLTAHVMPENADQSLTWSVVSGSEYASVADGVVTGVAEGEAVIRAASTDDPTLYSECTVTVNPAAAPLTDYYQKVTSTDNIVDGTYLIVYEDGSLAFNGGLDGLDVASNTIPVTIVGGDKIAVTEATAAATFFFDVTAGTIQAANGKYIGVSSNSNGLKEAEDANTYFNTFAIDAEGNAVITASFDASTMSLRYNKGSGQTRFRYYANAGQQPIALYKLANEVVKQDPGISWDPESAELTLYDYLTPADYPEPGLIIQADLGDNPLDFITLSSDNESLATINKTNDGQIKISWVPDVTGTVHFTAAFPGNDTYKAVNAVCTVTIKPEPAPASIDNVVILASFNNKLYAMSNTIDNKSCVAIEVEADGENIIVPSEEAKAAIQWTKDFNGTTATFQDANNKYLKGASSGGDLTLVDDEFNWTWDESTDYHCFVVGTRSFIFRGSTYNVFKNYAISNVTDPNNTQYAGVEIRVIDPENIIVTTKVDPELAFDPASVILTVGDNFVAPTLTYAEGFDGLAAVTYESSNPDLATVEGGVVSLVADATGTATITATFTGNENYLSGSATYTITVNEAGDDLSGTWVLASSVAAGDEIIIMGANNADIYTMGKQNPNNRAAVASSLDEDVLTPGAGTKVFTLVDAGNGKFAIQASNGNYLTSATSGTSNNLLEAADYDLDNAKWTISIEEGVASIVAAAGSKTVMQYNSSNTLFSCYGSANQKPVKIFKKEAVEPVPGNIVRDNLTAGNYYTICYPKEMSNVQGATLWSFIGKDANFAYLVKEDGPFEAGKPFILFATASTVTADLGEEVVTVAGENNGLFGTFDNLVQENFDGDVDIYLIIGNALRLVSGQSGNSLPANRAYVNLSEIQGGTPAHMPGRVVRSMPMHKDAATGISNIGASETPVKVLIDGQLFILRGEKMYDAKGQLVK